MDRIGPIAALHELIDALTAVGNYLIAADRLFDGNPALKQEKRLGEALGRPPLPLHDAPRLWRARSGRGEFAHCQLLDCCRLNMPARSALRRLHH
jgi:hypothetical protein